ncbi:hypothetical protein [Geobacillus kaustophilus]|uniref:hypothetical protein n=1 Tax=Geobacillus kaustophilus TaxID=1462 RepID=UPI0005CD1E46|nr:hypothetical protein [Geobacillus kaustophilus]
MGNFIPAILGILSSALTPCNVIEKANEQKKAKLGQKERALLKKYSAENESFGTSLGDLLKEVLKKKD